MCTSASSGESSTLGMMRTSRDILTEVMRDMTNTSSCIPEPDQMVQAAADQHVWLEGVEAHLQADRVSEQHKAGRGQGGRTYRSRTSGCILRSWHSRGGLHDPDYHWQ